MIFVIVKIGVCQQGIFGVFQDLEEAKEVAKTLAKKDVNAYHSYDVIETTFNCEPRVKFSKAFGNKSFCEKVVFSVNKNGIIEE
jgi:hypothetical protein